MPAPKRVSKTIVSRKKTKAGGAPKVAASHRSRQSVPLTGRDELTGRLARAHASNGLPPVLVLTGTHGVGKRRIAEWLAQLELCTEPLPTGPCGECRSCRMVTRFEHPDLHWFGPHASVGGGSTDAQTRAVDDLMAQRSSLRREDALAPSPPSSESYYVATIHALRRRLSQTPVMGSRRVVLLTDADRLMPHDESTGEAANALLKLLEEPPSGTTIRATVTNIGRLPATIRSRMATVAVSPLPDSAVTEILSLGIEGMDPDIRARAVASARGSIGRAVSLLSDDGRLQRDRARTMMEAYATGNHVVRLTAVRDTPPSDSRGGFLDLLMEMGDLASRAGAVCAGVPDTDPDVMALAGLPHSSSTLWMDFTRRITLAYGQAQRNLSPPLILARVLAPSLGVA